MDVDAVADASTGDGGLLALAAPPGQAASHTAPPAPLSPADRLLSTISNPDGQDELLLLQLERIAFPDASPSDRKVAVLVDALVT
eukprot:4798328-Prymnesium_polylepis.1